MKDSLQSGLEATRQFEIDTGRTISFMGEDLRVYATPYMVRDIEETSRLLFRNIWMKARKRSVPMCRWIISAPRCSA